VRFARYADLVSGMRTLRLAGTLTCPLPQGVERQNQPPKHCIPGRQSPVPVDPRLQLSQLTSVVLQPVKARHHYQCSATSGGSTTATRSKLRVTLDTDEISSSVEFSRTQIGQRSSVILVSRVKAGSVAEQEGLKVGQQLLAISNPSQPEDLWNLNERPSLRFVTDAVRLSRSSTVTIEVTGGGVDTSRASASQSSEPRDESEASLMDNIVAAAQSRDPEDRPSSSKSSLLDSVEEVIVGGKDGGPQTIASKLESAFKEEEDSASRERKQIVARKQRRRDYMERESTRDNTKLALGLAAAFFLPAFGILTYAFSSGLMDRIGSSYRY